MVESALKFILNGIKKVRFGATYNCFPFYYNYVIYFPTYRILFSLSIGRKYAIVEEKNIVNSVLSSTVFKITYRPPPSKAGEFEREIYLKYCNLLRSKFNGYYSWHCEVGMNEESCPILGSTIYSLYFHLDNDYIYPFLSHLLKAKLHIESCTPFMVRTRKITLLLTGVFSYRDRFSFSTDDTPFTMDCSHPYTHIRKAIRTIMHML